MIIPEKIDAIQTITALKLIKTTPTLDLWWGIFHTTPRLQSRNLLKILLSYYLNRQAAEIVIINNNYGKPLLDYKKAYKNNNINFNLSHSKNAIIYAIHDSTHGEIGIDLEVYNIYNKNNRNYLKIAKRFFTEREYHDLNTQINLVNQEKLFYRLWTGREAVIKALGLTISHPIYKQFRISFPDLDSKKNYAVAIIKNNINLLVHYIDIEIDNIIKNKNIIIAWVETLNKL